jgi:N-acetylneuraminic acid mutarotase
MPYCLLLLVLLASTGTAQNIWTPAGSNATARLSHSFTALADGRGLVVGGKPTVFAGGVATAELYDPVTNSWTPAATSGTPRADHTATLLGDGRVLVVGGCASGSPCASPLGAAEIYNPATNSWTPAGTLNQPRAEHSATLLANGKVLIVGGLSVCNSQVCNTLATTELFDPATNSFTPGPVLPQGRLEHSATLLASGNVLLAGGCSGSGLPCSPLGSLLYNAATNTIGNDAPMVVSRTRHTAVALSNGDVLVAGGVGSSGFTQKTAEIYRAATNTWQAIPDSNFSYFGHASERLPSGDVLVAGSNGPSAVSELYLVASNSWVQVGSLTQARTYARIARLTGGAVVITGGEDDDLNGIPLAERFTQGPTPLVSLVPNSLDFGYQSLLSQSSPLVVTVNNVGAAPLTISSVSLGGDNASDFSFTNQCASPVSPGGGCTVTVRFRPLAPKDRTAILSLTNNAPNSPHPVLLQGYGFIGAPNFWAPAGTMNQPRFDHTLTALPNGRALAIGGGGFTSTTAELYDSGTWTLSNPMNVSRTAHTATVLPDGRILAAGGAADASAEIYNPATNSWTLTSPMNVRRAGHAASLLPSGRVLISGGCVSGLCASTEIFDPATNAWTPGPNLSVARLRHTSTPLLDGRVLIAGGSNFPQAEIYNPASNTFSNAGAMLQARTFHTANRLPDGSVLVAGGCDGTFCATTETYSPATNRWRPAALMTVPRIGHVATTLSDGRVVAAGGIFFCDFEFGFCFATRAVDVYNPNTRRWVAFPILLEPRAAFAGTLLTNGQLLVSGGDDGFTNPRATAERLTPTNP